MPIVVDARSLSPDAPPAVEATEIAVATLATPIGPLHLYGAERGLLTIVLPNETRAAAEARLRRMLGPVVIREEERSLAAALAQLAAYFRGDQRDFDLALDPRGTPFQR